MNEYAKAGIFYSLKIILENDIRECYRLGMAKEMTESINKYRKLEAMKE